MRLLKPAWVTHGEDKPIFSIDIHPDGSRFATGGQGDNSGKVVIWNMAPISEEKYEKDENVPKLLCQMENHLACVNCVRWSNNGKYLASGGDDKIIIIWQSTRPGGPSTVFGSGGKLVNYEQWRPMATLRGHTGDVLDLAWSPRDVWFASCSVDNTIVIWNAVKFPEQIAVLKGHTGLVKGVTWDPVGKYIASQSDDKSLRIWRTLDWQQETCITEPFTECGGTTHVLRLSWSPDGQYVVSAHAMNNSGPTAQIVERNEWKTVMDFVGHRKAVTAVRFNPRILAKKIKKHSDKPQQYSCCAIGSRDRSLSIWLTALKRPLVVTHDLFQSSVLDISWSQTELELLCCSWDGTVAYMGFDSSEVGTPLTTEETQKLHQKIYGKSLFTPETNGNQIVETPAMLHIQQQKAKQKELEEEKAKTQAAKQLPPVSNSNHPRVGKQDSVPTNKQIETRTQDGKRRITPIFLAPQLDLNEGPPRPFSSSSMEPTFSSSKEKSRIDVEKQDIVVATTPSKVRENSSSSRTPQNSGSMDFRGSGSRLGSEAKTPTEKSTPQVQSAAQDKPGLTISPVADKPPDADKEKKDKDKTKLGAKRKLDQVTPSQTPAATPGTDPPPKKKDGRGRPRKYPLPTQVTPAATHVAPPQVIREPAQIVYSRSDLSLPVARLVGTASVQISGVVGSDTALALEVEPPSPGSSLHKVTCLRGGAGVWETLLPSKPIALAGNSHLSSIACDDQSVLLLSSSAGRRLYPPLVLDSKVSSLKCSGFYLMVITTKGSLFIWNIKTMSAVIKNESLVSIIPNSDVKLDVALLTEQGLPVITLNNGSSYTFKVELGCWVVISSKVDALHQCSDHSVSYDLSGEPQGPLSSLQSLRKKSVGQASRLYRAPPGGQQAATLSHLENQIACCLALQSAKEHHHWLITYIRYLVQEGLESKLREVCDDFLGPVFKSKNTTWEPKILGQCKRSILEEMLPIIGTNLRLQRLFTEYQEQISSLA